LRADTRDMAVAPVPRRLLAYLRHRGHSQISLFDSSPIRAGQMVSGDHRSNRPSDPKPTWERRLQPQPRSTLP
jgi:hypothetical protein